ncbi:hypothetical protein [Candidatus Viadribacter manganicus]|uniref:Uncharacterized protein n=1 Tax=Candidatus Viadribacter manganicus TaxID=1759059 RepID=A0A1B1AHF7_9PROT|nr:hypothetical protein [Candidatus Viadribacter manganicus]ANP45994.1 hypothetical protein ATE48_08710 [Candidatus Viadribacter manganicus]
MKERSKKAPLKERGDSKKMTEAIDWAQKHGLEIYRTTPRCVQIEGHNFWPDKGTIQRADLRKYDKKGLAELARLLEQPLPGEPGGLRLVVEV